jgi:hypothetical protein
MKSEYPLTVDKIASWFRSKEGISRSHGVVLAGVHERRGTDKPAAFADFDTEVAIGRIIVWVSGEIDFEILRRSNGKGVLFHHEDVTDLAESTLEEAFQAFLKGMTNPDANLLTLREV